MKSVSYGKIHLILHDRSSLLGEDEDGVLCVMPSIREECAPVRLSHYYVESRTDDIPKYLCERLRYFMQHCARLEAVDVEKVEVASGNLCYQAIGLKSDDHWWISRVIGSVEEREYWLVHWNGTEDVLIRDVIEIVDSVDFQ